MHQRSGSANRKVLTCLRWQRRKGIVLNKSIEAVLIVDDNPGVRSALRAFLERRGYRISGEAVDGVDAIHKAEEQKPDVILMDLAMPNLSGAGAAAVIRKTVPDTRIVIFTLYSDTVGRHLANALGVDLVIDKMEGAAGLTEAIDRILANKLPGDPPASRNVRLKPA